MSDLSDHLASEPSSCDRLKPVGFIGQRLKCCDVELANFHPECYPILISESDPFYGRLKQRCQEYVRSGVAPRTGCTLGQFVYPLKRCLGFLSFLHGMYVHKHYS